MYIQDHQRKEHDHQRKELDYWCKEQDHQFKGAEPPAQGAGLPAQGAVPPAQGAEPPAQGHGLLEPDQGVGPPATSIPQLDGMGDPEPAEQDRDQIVLRLRADQAEHEIAMVWMEEKLRKFEAGFLLKHFLQ